MKPFNESVSLVNTFGFSAVTVSGAGDGPLEPRTTSGSFHWDQEDVRKVQELRRWAATGQAAVPPAGVPLSKVEPRSYFDLTCQLLAKAPIDSTCTLLRVSTRPQPSNQCGASGAVVASRRRSRSSSCTSNSSNSSSSSSSTRCFSLASLRWE